MDSTFYLDVTAGGSFSHKTPTEGMEILGCITENNSFMSKPRSSREEHKSSHEDIPPAESDIPIPTTPDSALESSPESRDLEKKEFNLRNSLSNLRMIFLKIFRKSSNYFCKRKPLVPIASTNPIETAFRTENVKELTTIMSSERSRELELSSKILWISSHPLILPCGIRGTPIDTLYGPTVGANIISSEYAFCHL